jgi:hypothetical protein
VSNKSLDAFNDLTEFNNSKGCLAALNRMVSDLYILLNDVQREADAFTAFQYYYSSDREFLNEKEHVCPSITTLEYLFIV